jgi:hypothetical protein
MLSDRDMKDLRLSHDLATHELRKWPWQKFHPRWREMDDVLRRRLVNATLGKSGKLRLGDPAPIRVSCRPR